MILHVKTSLGIEMRDNELLMVAMKKGVTQWAVSGYKIFSNYKLANKADLRRDVQRFARSSRAAREQIVLGIPRDKAVMRLLDLPREVDENLEQVIKFQVENLTPAEDVLPYYDYSILSRQGTHLQILLVMVKKEVLDEHLGMIHSLGIQPNSVQLSTIGLSNLALTRPNIPPDAVNLLFNVGEKKLELVGTKNRQLWYSRHLQLTEDVPTTDLMTGEIDTALATMRLDDGQIEKIWFSGKDAEALLPDFQARVPDSDYLLKNFAAQVPKGMQPLLANDLAGAMGLALGALFKKPPVTINLLPKERRVHYNKWSFVPSIILGLGLIGLALAPTIMRYRTDVRFSQQLDAEIKKREPEVHEIKQLRKENETLQKKVETLEELIRPTEIHMDLLKDLTTRLNDDTYIMSYRLQKGELNLTVSSKASGTVVQKKLAESPYLKDVETTTEYPDPATGRKNITFKMKIVRKED